jgi:hypothetical protein
MSVARKSVIVVGDGYALRSTLSSVVSRHAGSVDIVAGVSDPNQFMPMVGVIPIKADLWDKASLTATLKERNYARLFLVLPGHADRLETGWNGLEASRNAGIQQVVVVSVLTAETHSDLEGHFRPLQDDIETLGRVPAQEGQQVDDSVSASSSVPPNAASMTSTDATDPSKCLRIQRKNGIQGWFPMKVKLVQFSLPNLKLRSRGGKAVKQQGDNGMAHLERSLCGPYRQEYGVVGLGNTLSPQHEVNEAMLLAQEQPVWQQHYIDSLQQFQTAAAPKEVVVPAIAPLAPKPMILPMELRFLPPQQRPQPQLQPPIEPFSAAFLRELQSRKEALAYHHHQPAWL